MTSELQGSGPMASSESLSNQRKTELGSVTAPFAEMTMNAISGLFAVLARSYPMIDTETANGIVNGVLTGEQPVEQPTAVYDRPTNPTQDRVVAAEVAGNGGILDEGLRYATWQGEGAVDQDPLQAPVIDMQPIATVTQPPAPSAGYTELGQDGLGAYAGGLHAAMIDDLERDFAAPSATDPSILDNQTEPVIAEHVGDQLDPAAIRASINAIHDEPNTAGAWS